MGQAEYWPFDLRKKTCVLLHEESKYNLLIDQINQRTWLLQIPGEFLNAGSLIVDLWILG